MKIIFVGAFGEKSTNVAQARGFEENGCEVTNFPYRDFRNKDEELTNLCKRTSPHLVFISKGNGLSANSVRACNRICKTVLWYMDPLCVFNDNLIEKIKEVNYFVTGLEGIKSYGLKYNPKSVFIQQNADEKIFKPVDDIAYKWDATFIGKILPPNKINEWNITWSDRRLWHEYLSSWDEINYAHLSGWNEKHNEIVNKTKVNLNFSHTDRTGASARIYKIMSSAGFLMSTPWYNMEKTFIDGEDFVSFYNPQDLKNKINYYLEHEEERNKIRMSGYKKVMENYTPKHWAKRIIELVQCSSWKDTSRRIIRDRKRWSPRN